MIPDGLELLKNMNDISDVATCNISSLLKQVRSALCLKIQKVVVFLEALYVMPFMGFIGDADISFSAKKYDLQGLSCF